jgi:hypothetical protein
MFSTHDPQRTEPSDARGGTNTFVSQLRTAVGESFSLSAGPDERPRIGGETGEWSEQRAASGRTRPFRRAGPGRAGWRVRVRGRGEGRTACTGYGEERRGARVPHVREVY